MEQDSAQRTTVAIANRMTQAVLKRSTGLRHGHGIGLERNYWPARHVRPMAIDECTIASDFLPHSGVSALAVVMIDDAASGRGELGTPLLWMKWCDVGRIV